ncbi:MAG TPA: hypothetical protein VGJ20_20170, partial [Xanthobacteraceae bacterium]
LKIQAANRVALVARVTGPFEQRLLVGGFLRKESAMIAFIVNGEHKEAAIKLYRLRTFTHGRNA